ncbi:MAG: glycosyltransferase family 4 protein, partial [Longimicrobiales bacterium]
YQPQIRWPGILAPFAADTMGLSVEQRGPSLCVSLEEETRCDLAPGAEAGWRLLFNRDGIPPLAVVLLSGAWLFLLAVPAGIGTRTLLAASAAGFGASVAYVLISWGVPWMSVNPPYSLIPLLGALAGGRVRRSGRTFRGAATMEDTQEDPIRIAYLANFAPAKLGTGETRLISLAREARERGHHLTIFCHEPVHPGVRDDLARAGASVESLEELSRRFFTGIRRFAREFDVIQLNLIPPRGRLALMAYAAWPSVVLFLDHVSGPPGSRNAQRRPLPLRILDRATMFRVHQVAGVSDYVRRRARDRFHLREERSLTLYGGVDPGRFSPDAPIHREGGPLRICTVAALIPEKGVGTLLEAVSRLTVKDWTLSVAGEGPEEEGLRALARELGIAEKVSFLGSRDDVPALLEGSDVFVHPAIWEEALGYTVLEGLAAGCAVVASRVGGIPEVVRDGVDGILVPPGDPPALAEALETLAGSPDLRRRLGSSGRARVLDRFTVERNLSRNLDWLEAAARGRLFGSEAQDSTQGNPDR